MTRHSPTRADDNPGGADAGGRKPRRAVRPKDAASLILWRDGPKGIEVLMGRRHRDMRFMPGVLVFPGGRVDLADYRARLASDLPATTRRMLEISARPSLATALAVCALRELEEEAGLVLGQMVAGRLHPALAPLHYLTRAITPADRPMRFHARFLIAEARHATGDIRGSGELEEVRFFALTEIPAQPLAKITAMILEEFVAWMALSPQARGRRKLFSIQGRDNRLPEGAG
ncbi:NUDIX domain-containing protein [Sediminicoccus sp. KRV36]|uniref:NUDIX hydrolase n=1 Tax=Sediminicoccus sp. KRV36 TaxID=3133721 RepID=UPI00200D73EC|nr:NUDIX domain-containing protein [Sediminicoccus rosea]UPY35253.1 NUDIX domain-containing protein [Sediminicoccus rosea]